MRERIGMDDVARATPSKEVCGRGLKEQSGGIQALQPEEESCCRFAAGATDRHLADNYKSQARQPKRLAAPAKEAIANPECG